MPRAPTSPCLLIVTKLLIEPAVKMSYQPPRNRVGTFTRDATLSVSNAFQKSS